MRLSTKALAPALLLAAIPLFAGSASAGPQSQSLALSQAETGTIEQVQYRRARRYHRGYYHRGYNAYAWAPRSGRRAWNYGNGSAATGPGSWARCPSDRFQASGYPSWMCR